MLSECCLDTAAVVVLLEHDIQSHHLPLHQLPRSLHRPLAALETSRPSLHPSRGAIFVSRWYDWQKVGRRRRVSVASFVRASSEAAAGRDMASCGCSTFDSDSKRIDPFVWLLAQKTEAPDDRFLPNLTFVRSHRRNNNGARARRRRERISTRRPQTHSQRHQELC